MKTITLLWCPVCKLMTAHEIYGPTIQCVSCLTRVPEPPIVPVNPLVDLLEGFMGRRPR